MIVAIIRYILYYYCNFCQIKICIYVFFGLKYNSRLRPSTEAAYTTNKTAPLNNHGSDAKITKEFRGMSTMPASLNKGVKREQST